MIWSELMYFYIDKDNIKLLVNMITEESGIEITSHLQRPKPVLKLNFLEAFLPSINKLSH